MYAPTHLWYSPQESTSGLDILDGFLVTASPYPVAFKWLDEFGLSDQSGHVQGQETEK